MATPRRPMRLALMVMAGCCALVVLAIVYRAQQALNLAAKPVGAGFTLRPLETSGHASPFEVVASAPGYTCGAQLDGQLYLAGPEGLTILSADGKERTHLRTGLELPVAQIAAVATGRLRGATEPQVLLATAGAGVLVVASDHRGEVTLQQLLPASTGVADVTSLVVSAAGDLLLGTRRAGVLVFDGATLEPLAMHLPGIATEHLQVTALAVADSTSVLIGTRNQGVFYVHAGMVEHAGMAEGMPDEQVDSLVVAGTGVLAGTPLGIAEFKLQGGEFRAAATLAPGVFAHALSVSADGREVRVGTLDQGFRTLPLGDAARLRQASIEVGTPAQRHGRVDAFIAGQPLVDGKLQGLAEPAKSSLSLTDRNISALGFDDEGSLFVGYFDRGLDVLAKGVVTHFEDDSLFCVNRLALDPRRKTMAAATANGLVLFDAQGAPRQTLTRKDGLLSEHVTDVAFTSTGTVLATPAGLTFVNAGGMESLYAFQGLVNNHVYALAADPATDHVLAGTLGGLSLLDQEQVRRNLTVANSGLKHNWITALAQDGPGEWLVGTYGAGVMRVSAQGTFAPIDLPAGARRDLVINPNALLVTATHAYAGTLGQGMVMYTAATGRWQIVTAGLPSLNVTAFAERNGELYVGTDNGLVRVAEASL